MDPFSTGGGGFLFVLRANPIRRYINAFNLILGVWLGAHIIPSLNVEYLSKILDVSYKTTKPSVGFDLTAITLMITLLVLDWKGRMGDPS